MAVMVLGGFVLLIGIWKLIALAHRPADRNFVSQSWLEDHLRGRRE